MASTMTEGLSEKNRGAWTNEEDRQLKDVIAIQGAKEWKVIANKAGLNRCGKSCRLRWLNYLRPDIKRGNISDQEEDLILRLHKLLGNRWSLIAQRLPGRTDNEIKNYRNSRLRKRINLNEKQNEVSKRSSVIENGQKREEPAPKTSQQSKMEFNVYEFFHFHHPRV